MLCLSENLQQYINQNEFIEEFKYAIQSLENRYFKRNNIIKESDNTYMELKELIENFKNTYKEEDYPDEKLRKEFIDKFPLDKLPTLELERYALG